MVGRYPARVTRIEYRPAGRIAVENSPRSFVSSRTGDDAASCSEETSTVAPICGVPAGSTTTPEILLAFGAGAAAPDSAPRHTKQLRPSTRIARRLKCLASLAGRLPARALP